MPYKEKSSMKLGLKPGAKKPGKKDPPKSPPKLKDNQSRPKARLEPRKSARNIGTGGGPAKLEHVYESHSAKDRGIYHQRKGAGKATANVKRKTAKAAPTAAARAKAAAPGRKTYTDMAGFLSIKK